MAEVGEKITVKKRGTGAVAAEVAVAAVAAVAVVVAFQEEAAPLSGGPREGARKTVEETETVTGGIAIATAIIGSEIGIEIEIEDAPLPLLTRAAPPCPPARCPSL